MEEEKVQVAVNDTFYQLYDTNGTIRRDLRYLIVYGGRRSAKSYEVSHAITSTIIQEPDHFVVVCRKVAATCKDSVFKRYKSALTTFGMYPYLVKENKTDREYILTHNDSRIRCFGLDNPEKLKSLEDATIIVMEEFTEFTQQDLDSLDAGLSPSKYPGLIVIIFNPIPIIPGNPHFIQDRFLNKVEKKRGELMIGETSSGQKFGVLNVNYTHNLYCPEANVKRFEEMKEKQPELYKMWGLGDFTHLEGTIFSPDEWDVVEFNDIADNADFIGYGMDFGWTDPTTLVGVWANPTDIWIQALMYDTETSNNKIVDRMRRAGVEEFDRIVGDSADPKTIRYIKDAGFRSMRAAKKKKNYKREVAFKMKGYKIHLIEYKGSNSGNPAPLQGEFSTWCWEMDPKSRDSENKRFLPQPVDGNDHLIDATIMLCHEYLTDKTHHDITYTV